ncbi:MAG TPA: hypothetical protein VI141_00525 [Acidimicrobiia bacterium]
MPTSLITLDVVQDRLAEAVATRGDRTPAEQSRLLADLLAQAFAVSRRSTS